MLYNIILHLSLKFGGYKCKNMDFRPKKPLFRRFFAVCGKWHFFRPGSRKSFITQKAFNEIECGFLHHLEDRISQKTMVLHFFKKFSFFCNVRFAKKNVF